MNKLPSISIVMPVFNAERYLSQALESLLGQTYGDFELIVIDDGSTDTGGKVIEKYRALDARIVVRRQENLGVTEALNRGLAMARGEYLARMDADDIALPNRFARQIEFMRDHPQVGLLATRCRLLHSDGTLSDQRDLATSDLEIRWASLFQNPLAHPTVMMRRRILEQHDLRYSFDWPAIEDYDLWTRLLPLTQAATLDEPLLLYRVHPESVCSRRRELQLANRNRIGHRAMTRQFPDLSISPSEAALVCDLFAGAMNPPSGDDPRRVDASWLYLRLLREFAMHHRQNSGLRDLVRAQARKIMTVLSDVPLHGDMVRLLAHLVWIDPRLSRLLLRAVGQRTFGRRGSPSHTAVRASLAEGRAG